MPPHSLAQAAGANTTLGSRWTLLKNVGWQTSQRSNARLSSFRLGSCILDKYQPTLPSVRGRPVVMQTSGAATEKLRSEEALYIAPNSNTTPLGLYSDPRPDPEKYSAPQSVFSDWDKEECCPDLANSQHREDMSKAPPSLILGSVVSAVFGGRWACAHLAAHAGVGRTRAVAREDTKPASAVNSFKLLCRSPHFYLTGSVPASPVRLIGFPFSRMSSFKLSMCRMTPLYIFHQQSVTLQTH